VAGFWVGVDICVQLGRKCVPVDSGLFLVCTVWCIVTGFYLARVLGRERVALYVNSVVVFGSFSLINDLQLGEVVLYLTVNH
jgi:hypothetical protein